MSNVFAASFQLRPTAGNGMPYRVRLEASDDGAFGGATL
jgi:hypothetical protein